jgi:MFS family permease
LDVFVAGAVVCAAAQTSPVFIFGRALLGFGAAGLLQGALAIIGFTVALKKVPLFQGVVVSALGVSVCIGPVLGGVLTDTVGWSEYIAEHLFLSSSPISLKSYRADQCSIREGWCFWMYAIHGTTVPSPYIRAC